MPKGMFRIPVTNYDDIHNMTKEELSEKLADLQIKGILDFCRSFGADFMEIATDVLLANKEGIAEDLLKWLEEEVEE